MPAGRRKVRCHVKYHRLHAIIISQVTISATATDVRFRRVSIIENSTRSISIW